MLWASIYLTAGLLVILLLSFRRKKPKALEGWLFAAFVILLLGMVSLGLTGSAVAFVFTPILNLLGFPSTALRSSWLGAMALSLLCPPGLVVAHLLARARQRSAYLLIFLVSLFVYFLLASAVVYVIIERV
jgi:hypothetical protein